MANKGSTRVTVRVGDDLLDLIDAALDIRNEKAVLSEQWNRTDFIIKAIQDKLNHGHRSCKRDITVTVEKVGEYEPRIVEMH